MRFIGRALTRFPNASFEWFTRSECLSQMACVFKRMHNRHIFHLLYIYFALTFCLSGWYDMQVCSQRREIASTLLTQSTRLLAVTRDMTRSKIAHTHPTHFPCDHYCNVIRHCYKGFITHPLLHLHYKEFFHLIKKRSIYNTL